MTVCKGFLPATARVPEKGSSTAQFRMKLYYKIGSNGELVSSIRSRCIQRLLYCVRRVPVAHSSLFTYAHVESRAQVAQLVYMTHTNYYRPANQDTTRYTLAFSGETIQALRYKAVSDSPALGIRRASR